MSVAGNGIEDIYPLSPMQQGMLFHSLYAPSEGMYHAQKLCTLQGELHVACFARAWQEVVDRHAVLRTSFVWDGVDQPVQVVQRKVRLPWEQYDWRGLAGDEQRAARLEELLRADRARGFDLSAAPLMRLTLIQTGADTFYFVWSHHHLLTDGWCVATILEEVLAFYEAQKQMRPLQLPPRRPYRDYIAWLQQQDLSCAAAFWRVTLKGFSVPTPLGNDPGTLSSVGADEPPGTEQLQLSMDTTARLQDLARQHQLTLNTFVQGAWALLLGRYSGEQDVVFGATVSGRPPALTGVETMIGLFINTLPVRVQIQESAPVITWLKHLQAAQAEMRQYEYSSLVEIQGWSEVPRSLPLFKSILAFENFPVNHARSEQQTSIKISDVRLGIKTNYALSIIASPASRLDLSIIYDRAEFTATTIKRLLGHFQTILAGMAARPQQRVSELEVLTDVERYESLVKVNETAHRYAQAEQCLHQLFEAQAARDPQAVAVVFGDEQLRYGELNERSNQLAHHLRRLGVGPEKRVGICVERSLELVVGILGILKSGAAYVPLDPAYPPDRISFMLADAQVAVLLTQAHLKARLPQAGAETLALDADWKEIAQNGSANPTSEATPNNLAYVIYTSGSTGRPKGIALSHRGVVNNLLDLNHRFAVGPTDRVLALSSLSFDMCVYEVLGTLAAGGGIVLPAPLAQRDPAAWAELIMRHRVTVWNSAPALLELLVDYAGLRFEVRLAGLRLALLGGDWVPVALPARLKALAPGVRVIVMGGATEASIHSTIYEVETPDPNWQSIPYGVPMANQRAYILDAAGRPMPVGVPGELHLGGIGLARGYFNQPGLTAEKFVPDSFSRQPGARLYKTGDQTRYRPDGNIELLGRVDYQVKIRGFRIELEEIVAALKRHAAIKAAVVITLEDEPGDKRLVAYAVCRPDAPAPTVTDLRACLKETLPDYMVPSAFVLLDNFPLSPNGKVDRNALPAPDRVRPELAHAFAAPRTPVEEVVAGTWAEVLNVERVGVDDNFFDLGGHSLLATQLISRVRESFQLELPLRTLFEAPTVAELAGRIEAAGREAQTDAGRIAQLILQLNQMSDEQASAMLAQRSGALAENEEELT